MKIINGDSLIELKKLEDIKARAFINIIKHKMI